MDQDEHSCLCSHQYLCIEHSIAARLPFPTLIVLAFVKLCRFSNRLFHGAAHIPANVVAVEKSCAKRLAQGRMCCGSCAALGQVQALASGGAGAPPRRSKLAESSVNLHLGTQKRNARLDVGGGGGICSGVRVRVAEGCMPVNWRELFQVELWASLGHSDERNHGFVCFGWPD